MSFKESILSWYDENKRSLPFRDIKNPYFTWLSEIMLQQTQVNTMIPYFNRWINIFPTLNDVANATEQEVLKLWEGLGYYSRCRNFQKATQIVMKNYDGVIPNNYNEFLRLPGVGPYTAAAVMSIAFNKSIPAIDGNIRRVSSRILGRKKMGAQAQKRIRNYLEREIEHHRPGDFNQALMDLGSSICTPQKPMCKQCPINTMCFAMDSGNPELYPEKRKKKKSPHYNVAAGLIWDNDKFFIQKRSAKSLLGGVWEFPGGKVEKGETVEGALKRELKEECNIEPTIHGKAGAVKHVFSHFSIDLTVFHCSIDEQTPKTELPNTWITPNEIKQYPFPAANHKLFKILDQNDWNI
jgi:A/G-specific adenine glycosylase